MNLISLSLWGTSELYLEGAVANARLAPSIYPGWMVRAYCSPEVPVLDLLRSLGVDVRIMPSAPGYGGLFWRFLPAAENDVEYVIIRDADSRLNVREKAAVDAWIASGLPFHVMRDHVQHRNAPMLAGMWGCRGGSIPDMPDRIARFERGASKHRDTRFLREEIWPLIDGRCVVHSSVPEPLGGDPFPAHPEFDGFVGEIVDPRDEAEEVIAILLPSRGRPEAALAAARSARATASAPEHLRVVVGVEPDEADAYREVFADDAAWIHALQSGGNYVRAIRELQRSTAAGIYGLSADDFAFEMPGWDDRIRKAVAELPERLGLVYGDDGLQRERIATAPFLTAEWIACVGDVLPGDYVHMYCDTELTEIARLAGLLRFLPHVKITHRHHAVGDAVFDSTYERSAATMAAGRAEFQQRGGERQQLADRLAEASRAPLLSILISSLVQRADVLDELLAGLRRQLDALPDRSIVEVLVEPDAGERSAAAKRKSLLARARGRWLTFIDDDEVVAGDAVAAILRAVEREVDCVTFGQPAGLGAPTSKRIAAIRRSAALKASRKDAKDREDFVWSGTMSRFLKSEATIDQVVFHRRATDASAHVRREVVEKSEQGRAGDASALGLPTPQQQLLLTAALGRDEVALGAWEKWRSEIGPALADPASTRLLPLVWWRLQRLGVSGIEVNALKPSYWQSWAANLEHLRLAGEMAAVFEKAGIPTVLLKGVALAARHYAEPALRPMSDVDLMVPEARAEEARLLLTAAGWRSIANPPESALGLLHGLGFKDRAGRLIDLHWHSLVECSRASVDDGFWARAESIDLGGASARVLAPADQLLHVCVHGLRWSGVPAIQWVADAMAILSSAAERVDWDVLLAEARARRVVLHMRRTLGYVRDTFEVAALDGVCRRLASQRSTIGDRIDFEVRLRPPSLGRAMLLFWFDHQRQHDGEPRLSRWLAFPSHLRRIWGLRSLTEVPATAARKSAGMLRGRSRA